MIFKRVLIKVSGEAFSSNGSFGVNAESVASIAKQLKTVSENGVKVGVVVGGGNFLRGRQVSDISREMADYMGIMATTLNAIALKDSLNKLGAKSRLLSPLKIDSVADYCSEENIETAFSNGEIALFCCGTGKPFVSTDSGAACRAVDMKADILLCAKKIDGVYDSDPAENKFAKRCPELTYNEVIERNLQALDKEAIEICRDNAIKILVFSKDDEDSIVKAALSGKFVGTIIC